MAGFEVITEVMVCAYCACDIFLRFEGWLGWLGFFSFVVIDYFSMWYLLALIFGNCQWYRANS